METPGVEVEGTDVFAPSDLEHGASAPKGLLFTDIMHLGRGCVSTCRDGPASFCKLQMTGWDSRTTSSWGFAFLRMDLLTLLFCVWAVDSLDWSQWVISWRRLSPLERGGVGGALFGL